MSQNNSNNFAKNNKSVAEFYRDSNIFITGTTGFIGKSLIEKLLRTCNHLDGIYLLIRGKNGKSAEERFQTILSNSIFDKIRKESPQDLNKIKIIEGDIEEPNLGMNENDMKLLIDKINVVFHSAATIRFNENLTKALRTNTLGTLNLIDFSCKMNNIKTFVYVSTAYANTDKDGEIAEIVYQSKHKPRDILKLLETNPDLLDKSQSKYIDKHPNTYTFSKSLTENLLLEYADKIPIAIVRPSTVCGSWMEPYEGWFDGINLINAFIIQAYYGHTDYYVFNKEAIIDLIPVDILTNSLLAVAWYTDLFKFDTVRVYHCCSSLTNPLRIEQLVKYIESYNKKSIRFKSDFHSYVKITSKPAVHKVLWFFTKTIPAQLYDITLITRNKQPTAAKWTKTLEQHSKVVGYFVSKGWTFHDNNMRLLEKTLERTDDGYLFNISMSKRDNFDWYDYLKMYTSNVIKWYKNKLAQNNLKKLQENKLKSQL